MKTKEEKRIEREQWLIASFLFVACMLMTGSVMHYNATHKHRQVLPTTEDNFINLDSTAYPKH